MAEAAVGAFLRCVRERLPDEAVEAAREGFREAHGGTYCARHAELDWALRAFLDRLLEGQP